MTCDDVRARFSDVADGRLAARERIAWQAHLERCTECQREWKSFERTLALLHGLPRHRAPEGFVERVLAAARPRPWPRRLAHHVFLPLRVKLPMEAAALVLVAVGAVYLAHRTPVMQEAMRDSGPAPGDWQPAPAVPAPLPAREPDAQRAAAPPRSDAARELKKSVSEKTAASSPDPVERALTREATPEAAPAPGITAPSRSDQPEERLAATPPEGRGGARIAEPPGVASAPRVQDAGRIARREAVSRLSTVAPAVTGRLAVENRDAAERALAELITRLGATELRRTPAENGMLVELEVPRAQYAEFARGLAAIGGWTPHEELVEASADVRVRVIVIRQPGR